MATKTKKSGSRTLVPVFKSNTVTVHRLDDADELLKLLPGLRKYLKLTLSERRKTHPCMNGEITERELLIDYGGPAIITHDAIWIYLYRHGMASYEGLKPMLASKAKRTESAEFVAMLAKDYGLTTEQLVELVVAKPDQKQWAGKDVAEMYSQLQRKQKPKPRSQAKVAKV